MIKINKVLKVIKALQTQNTAKDLEIYRSLVNNNNLYKSLKKYLVDSVGSTGKVDAFVYAIIIRFLNNFAWIKHDFYLDFYKCYKDFELIETYLKDNVYHFILKSATGKKIDFKIFRPQLEDEFYDVLGNVEEKSIETLVGLNKTKVRDYDALFIDDELETFKYNNPDDDMQDKQTYIQQNLKFFVVDYLELYLRQNGIKLFIF